ncbi:hypothetical protein [Flavobacterium sp. UMI-01]|uniref:hypothetical protein n=1 Tax=Flavobacterium sp. UMI-01 TaxID=1441053 RepID=UPI001C7CCF63|nr:hypothetical protein [Flavobacterium sp. UMI-01]GIZ10295.1 hypothetical protein FUMI01_30190 [Flavobacterium sp. UMI-01]
MAFKDTVKEWFKTGLKPTQAQFYSKFDFLRWRDEKIPISDIEEIEGILNEKADAEAFNNHVNGVDAHEALFDAKQNANEKGEANGYVPLDELTKIAAIYLNIVNDLVTGGSDALASAETVKTLKAQIDAINVLLTSDDVNLDTVQEIVDAIKEVETSLETILVNDLTTGGTTKALTAEMGKTLKGLIDALTAFVTNHMADPNAHLSLFNGKEDKTQKGIANGYAPLDATVKIAAQYLNIVNDLVTGGTSSLLSAEQGKQLKGLIDTLVKGTYPNNTSALNDGLVEGDLYHLPIENDVYVLAVVKGVTSQNSAMQLTFSNIEDAAWLADVTDYNNVSQWNSYFNSQGSLEFDTVEVLGNTAVFTVSLVPVDSYIYLYNLYLTGLELTGDFDNNIVGMSIQDNEFTTFPDTIFPAGLVELDAGGNGNITEFDPSNPFPSSLESLGLNSLSLSVFNPTIPLPSTLSYINLQGNDITTSSWNNDTAWINNLGNGGSIYTAGNTNTIAGTNSESLLLAKSWTVNT